MHGLDNVISDITDHGLDNNDITDYDITDHGLDNIMLVNISNVGIRGSQWTCEVCVRGASRPMDCLW